MLGGVEQHLSQRTGLCTGQGAVTSDIHVDFCRIISAERPIRMLESRQMHPMFAAVHALLVGRNCQYLWIGLFQATSVPVDSVGAESADGVMSVGRSSSLPLWKIAPARTRATRCGALTARQRACAASISL